MFIAFYVCYARNELVKFSLNYSNLKVIISLKICRIRSYELNHKLREPSRISYQSTDSAKNVLVLIETDENIYGIGEAAPFKPSTGDTQKIALKFLKLAKIKARLAD